MSKGGVPIKSRIWGLTGDDTTQQLAGFSRGRRWLSSSGGRRTWARRLKAEIEEYGGSPWSKRPENSPIKIQINLLAKWRKKMSGRLNFFCGLRYADAIGSPSKSKYGLIFETMPWNLD
ncbi:hypoxanthine/guanine phosphoribosyltransferase [Striga asiatica]|uniref:Hypoxanthine/guanine phosphoribosyltransferase n=1 Tax=Striga asiatica TaxID=4170 RepID=A0A5A7R8L4_STRAF|nr:hypoxanthine/guanine phosphoribosyltransferase [Striga asiatica]